MGILFMQSVINPIVIGQSKGIQVNIEACQKASRGNDPVLFQGELGTGKRVLATYLHFQNEGTNKPFMFFDCSDHMLVEQMFNNELALESRFQPLMGGTLYLREAACLALSHQAQLYQMCLMAQSLGIRVLLSSSQNIHLLFYEKAFHSELYHYFSQKEIKVSPLRQRKEDIPELIKHYIQILNIRLRKSVQGLTPQAEEILMSYRWPGNVEELEYILTRAMLLSKDAYIGRGHLTEYLGVMGENLLESQDVMPLERMEEILLRSALTRYGSTLEGKKRAARALNISLATLYNKVKRFNLNT